MQNTQFKKILKESQQIKNLKFQIFSGFIFVKFLINKNMLSSCIFYLRRLVFDHSYQVHLVYQFRGGGYHEPDGQRTKYRGRTKEKPEENGKINRKKGRNGKKQEETG